MTNNVKGSVEALQPPGRKKESDTLYNQSNDDGNDDDNDGDDDDYDDDDDKASNDNDNDDDKEYDTRIRLLNEAAFVTSIFTQKSLQFRIMFWALIRLLSIDKGRRGKERKGGKGEGRGR